MKRNLLLSTLFVFPFIFSSFYLIKDSNGKAGYTGSPGENYCGAGGCHAGGSSASKGITVTATPSFSLDQYYPDSVYTISVTLGATGFSKFGFACEVLDNNSVNIGLMSTPGAGVKQANSGVRKNMTHTTPKSGTNQATFTFKWQAPGLSSGDAIFYVGGNAVNGNGNTSGDLPMLYSYTVSEGTPPVDPNVGISKQTLTTVSNLNVFPNPSNGLCSISYSLKSNKTISIELVDLNGKTIKLFSTETHTPGEHTQLLDLHNIAPGVYFIKALADKENVAQKLITVN